MRYTPYSTTATGTVAEEKIQTYEIPPLGQHYCPRTAFDSSRNHGQITRKDGGGMWV
jgi:hypothetical protein